MITDITMDEIIHGLPNPDTDLHVLMFFGPTCGPCKATMPHYEETAQFFIEKGSRVKFYRINAWEPAEQATFCREKLKVEGVPTFRAYCNSQQVSEKVGGGDTETMKQFIHDCIGEVFTRFGEKI
jgi:thiol-disulfide isomerase/thioredoxin